MGQKWFRPMWIKYLAIFTLVTTVSELSDNLMLTAQLPQWIMLTGPAGLIYFVCSLWLWLCLSDSLSRHTVGDLKCYMLRYVIVSKYNLPGPCETRSLIITWPVASVSGLLACCLHASVGQKRCRLMDASQGVHCGQGNKRWRRDTHLKAPCSQEKNWQLRFSRNSVLSSVRVLRRGFTNWINNNNNNPIFKKSCKCK